MAQIGNLGKLIVFEVSADKVLTFSSFQQTVKGRWTAHSRIKKKPVYEFLGADTRSVALKINLNSTLGVKPRTVLSKIEKRLRRAKRTRSLSEAKSR